jgi:chromosome segregation ATPase
MGEYFDPVVESCIWDVFGYYTITDLPCEEQDHYVEDDGTCAQWDCETLGGKIDELFGAISTLAPTWNEALKPIQEADVAMQDWNDKEAERLERQREEQAEEVNERRETLADAKGAMREAQEALNEANRALTMNRDPEAVAELQLAVFSAQDEFDLLEARALNAEFFYDTLKAQYEDDAGAYAD